MRGVLDYELIIPIHPQINPGLVGYNYEDCMFEDPETGDVIHSGRILYTITPDGNDHEATHAITSRVRAWHRIQELLLKSYFSSGTFYLLFKEIILPDINLLNTNEFSREDPGHGWEATNLFRAEKVIDETPAFTRIRQLMRDGVVTGYDARLVQGGKYHVSCFQIPGDPSNPSSNRLDFTGVVDVEALLDPERPHYIRFYAGRHDTIENWDEGALWANNPAVAEQEYWGDFLEIGTRIAGTTNQLQAAGIDTSTTTFQQTRVEDGVSHLHSHLRMAVGFPTSSSLTVPFQYDVIVEKDGNHYKYVVTNNNGDVVGELGSTREVVTYFKAISKVVSDANKMGATITPATTNTLHPDPMDGFTMNFGGSIGQTMGTILLHPLSEGSSGSRHRLQWSHEFGHFDTDSGTHVLEEQSVQIRDLESIKKTLTTSMVRSFLGTRMDCQVIHPRLSRAPICQEA
ncbi:MAG: hypothetical protein ACTSUE_10280 [Promethearchaeota archaeon]